MSGSATRFASAGHAQATVFGALDAPPPDGLEASATHPTETPRAIFDSPTRKALSTCGALIIWLASEKPPARCAFCGEPIP